MREIKFKVLDKKTKNIIGHERINDEGHFQFKKINREGWLLGINTSEDDLIRCQYTGFNDKNGNEIYEGDMLSLQYSRDKSGTDIIKFTQSIEWEDGNGFSGWSIPFLESAEIIGNIWMPPTTL